MKILFIAWRDLSHPRAGGSEIVIDRLARELVSRGHEVALLCGGPATPGGQPYRVIVNGGELTQYLLAPLRYLRSFRQWDVVVDVENGLPFFAPLWRRRPVIGYVHHVSADEWSSTYPRVVASLGAFAERFALRFLYRNTPLVSVSPSTSASLHELGLREAKVHLVVNGVDDPPARVATTKSPTPLFVALSRLMPNKRYDRLLQMWEQVHQVVGGRLVIAGDGPERSRLESRAPRSVEFHGRISDQDKYELFQQAWVFLHPAEREGWGLVILEAARVGTPAVGFDVPGVRDAIVHGETGFLEHDERSFVAAWIRLATDQTIRERCGRQAQERSREFTWQNTADCFLGVVDGAAGVSRDSEALASLGSPPRSGPCLASRSC